MCAKVCGMKMSSHRNGFIQQQKPNSNNSSAPFFHAQTNFTPYGGAPPVVHAENAVSFELQCRLSQNLLVRRQTNGVKLTNAQMF